jgi:NADH:ubiquinone oxidoreductase subunit 6 (subunit J)
MAEVIFFLAGTGAIAGAIGTVVLRNAFYAVLALVFHLLCLAALFLLLRAEFVAAAQVVVYAGGVMVLYLFVVAYIGADSASRMRPLGGPGLRAFSVFVAVVLAVELMLALLGTGLKGVEGEGAQWDPPYGTPQQIGELLLTKFLLPFEIASVLLLVAAVGAVVLARRRPEDEAVAFTAPPMPAGVGAMTEATGHQNPTAMMNAVRAGEGSAGDAASREDES